MAKLMGFKLPQQFMVGFIAGIFSTVLVWLASLVEGISSKLITALQGRAAMITGTELGTKLMQTLGGNWMLGVPDILVAGIGGGMLVMIGTWMYRMDWSPDAIPFMKSTPITQLTLVLFYASALATVVLGLLTGSFLSALIVLFINSIITAWFVVAVLKKQLGLIQ